VLALVRRPAGNDELRRAAAGLPSELYLIRTAAVSFTDTKPTVPATQPGPAKTEVGLQAALLFRHASTNNVALPLGKGGKARSGRFGRRSATPGSGVTPRSSPPGKNTIIQ
jgi:hypothetical protein